MNRARRPLSASSINRLTAVGALAALVSVLPLLDITLTRNWLLPAAIAVVAVVLTGFLFRSIGVPLVFVPLIQLAALGIWIGVLVADQQALIGFVPTADWARRLVEVFESGVETVYSYRAPIPVSQGILMMLVGGAGVVALLVDLTIVALRRVALTGVPLAACYAVAATFAPGGLAWYWFLPPAAGFLALLIIEGQGTISAWGRSATPSAVQRGLPKTDSLARNGRRVSAVALVAAVSIPAVAPMLSEGVFGTGGPGGGGGGQTIRTDNPIVDLQRNLQRPANVDVLRYSSSANSPQYIRTVTLDVFNGEVWQTSDRAVPDSVDDGLPVPQGMRLPDVASVDYTFEVTDNYSSRWLPLPYPAQQIQIEGDWRYHDATLDVVSTEDDVRATTYTVRSLDIQPTVEQLQAAGEPSDDVAPSLELPDDLPDLVTSTALEVTDGLSDDFSRAAALQSWFRTDGGFVYDIESQPGHSATALSDFLTGRRGYCEQFAATMAIMARTLGIPSRVAVGFTPGDYQGDGTWLIRAHDSHAWPELYFDGIGWVRFEPTPATRSGSAPGWTFVPNAPSTPGTPNNPAAPQPTSSASAPALPIDQEVDSAGGLVDTSTSAPWHKAVLSLLGGVLVLSLPWAFALLRRRLRWQNAGTDPSAGAEAAWSDLRHTVIDAGLPWDLAETPRTTARRITADVALRSRDVTRLNRLVTATERARYSCQPGRSAGDAAALRADAAALRRSILGTRSFARRALAFFWPTAARDAVTGSSRLMSDALDWLDTAGPRLRSWAAHRMGRPRSAGGR